MTETETEKIDSNLNQNAFKSILNMYRLKANNNNMLARSVVITMLISGGDGGDEHCCFVVD